MLLPSPTYPIYASILTRLGIEARYYRLDESDGWQPDTAHIESLTDAHTRAIVVINPNNPTGAVYGRDVLMRIIDIANRHNLLIMCDEIYERLVLDDSKKMRASSHSTVWARPILHRASALAGPF